MPCVIIVDPTNLPDVKKYKFTGEINKDNLTSFVQSWLNGELIPFLKSDEIPEENDSIVKEIVGKNYEKIVSDGEKDVIVYIYKKECDKCIEIEPVYAELAKSLSKNTNLLFTKLDGSNNQIEVTYEIFPTFLFYPGNNKKDHIKFEGELNFRELNDFVLKNRYFQYYKNDL